MKIGLINQVVPADQLKKVTYRLARSIADGPPTAIQLTKKGLHQGLNADDIRTQIQFGNSALNACLKGKDIEEGLSAFLGKRKPLFNVE